METKFKTGDRVYITKGQYKEKVGEILDVDQIPDESVEQKYIVKLQEKPYGVLLPENCLDPYTDKDEFI